MGSLIWTITDIANIIRGWQDEDYDGRILATGGTGKGKSTLLLKIARRIPDFKIRKHLAFKRHKLMKLMAENRKKVLIGDEMINAAYNRDFHNKEQNDFIKMINMYRDRNNILLAANPNFTDMDKKFRASIKIRLDVIRRGLAIVHTPNETSYSPDPWDIELNKKIEMLWFKKRMKSGNFKANYRQLTTFRGILRFGKLPPKYEALYKSIKDRERNEIYEEEMSKEEKQEVSDVDGMIKLAKEGRIDKEYVLNYCMMKGRSYTALMRMINNKLRDQGDSSRIMQLLKSNENKKNDDKIKISPKIPVI